MWQKYPPSIWKQCYVTGSCITGLLYQSGLSISFFSDSMISWGSKHSAVYIKIHALISHPIHFRIPNPFAAFAHMSYLYISAAVGNSQALIQLLKLKWTFCFEDSVTDHTAVMFLLILN